MAEAAAVLEHVTSSDGTRIGVPAQRPGAAAREPSGFAPPLPDARISVLRGQGHAAIMTAPALVADELARFLRQ